MNSKYKLWICIIGNFIVLLFVIIMCELSGQGSKYWQFGPNKDLIVITTKIDTYFKYFLLFFIIFVVNTVKMFVEEIGAPVLGFNVYNPDKKHIEEFTKIELQIYANLMFGLSNIRAVFTILVQITQIDIALWSVLSQEFIAIITIRLLLNEKTFGKKNREQKYELINQV